VELDDTVELVPTDVLEVEEGEVEWVVLVETELEADVVVGCDDDEGKDDEL
jgi:hypothetical protein